MPGAVEPEYVAARRVLLDALAVLGSHRGALVLVGAQAIYLHVGDGGFDDLPVQPFTTDGDLAIHPDLLTDDPRVPDLLGAAGFTPGEQPGMWRSREGIRIDLMVPASLGRRPGRRGASLGPHGRKVARQARGLEAALVDNAVKHVAALDDRDTRAFDLFVAGPAALLVAKMHKLADRRSDADRLVEKDALDVLRLLRGVSSRELEDGLRRLSKDSLSAEVTEHGIRLLADLFGEPGSVGSVLAGRAVRLIGDPAEIATSCAVLAGDLLRRL